MAALPSACSRLIATGLLNLGFWWWNQLMSLWYNMCFKWYRTSFDQREVNYLKQEKSDVGPEWTCQKIGRQAGRSVDVSVEGFVPWIQVSGLEEWTLCQGDQSCGVNMLIGQKAAKEDNAPKDWTKHRWTNDMPDNIWLMLCNNFLDQRSFSCNWVGLEYN